MTSLSPALSFRDVSFHYQVDGGKQISPILNQVSLDIHAREFITIIGPSGSGKSTMFRLITGLEQPVAGAIELGGSEAPHRHGKVGYMPQKDLLLPWRTILDNAALPLELKGVSRQEAQRQVLPMLEEFGLKGTESKYPGNLSGGMRQRVSFLRSVLSGSDVLLLDEPFSALDAITRLSMQEWLLEQWELRGKTILFITHDVDEALFLSDRIFIFQQAPISRLEEVTVPLARPRTIKDLTQPAVAELKQQLIDRLRKRVD